MPKERRPRPAAVGLMGTMLGALFSYEPPDMEALKPVEPLNEQGDREDREGTRLSPAGRPQAIVPRDRRRRLRPYNGVRRLSNWAKDYQKLLAEPIGEKKRAWPAELLPIVYLNGHRVCMNRNGGAIVRWTKPPARCSEAKWMDSFAPQALVAGRMARTLGRHADAGRRGARKAAGRLRPRRFERRQLAESGQAGADRRSGGKSAGLSSSPICPLCPRR